jgi:uncharacterized protein (DUF1330 family)
MATYVIYQGAILDDERYAAYGEQVIPNVTAAGGRFLVVGGDGESLEGALPAANRTVVIEFDTRQAAIEWYRGAGYTEIRKLRAGAADVTMYIVDGFA